LVHEAEMPQTFAEWVRFWRPWRPVRARELSFSPRD
jgi:hypothetical protein